MRPFSKAPTAVALGLGLFVAYRSRVWVGFDPVARRMPSLPVLEENRKFARARLQEKHYDAPGAESFAFSEEEGVYTGLADGRVAKFNGSAWSTVFRTCGDTCPPIDECGASPTDVAKTETRCGRPLGLRLLPATKGGEEVEVLVVADAYFGLLKWERRKGSPPTSSSLRVVASNFTLLNDVATDGRYAYATETSSKWQRRRIFYAALEMRPTGRLWKIDLETGDKEVLLDDLLMPNGVELLLEDSLVVVCGVEVVTVDLRTAVKKTFIPALPGFGDNVRLAYGRPDGSDNDTPFLWFALGSKYAEPFNLLKALDQRPKLRTFLVGVLPYRVIVDLIPKAGLLAIYDLQGTLVETYQDPKATILDAPWFSEVHAFQDWLYVGSWYNDFMLRIYQPDLLKKTKSS
mmetsp:Transcript_31381/g.100822  ORF Transcript_31381/g.100822 Transcript_31381/m.100822 type:complete len:404 (-) Transcript_31381:94-1305(-)